MNLSTRYLGLRLRSPLMPSASPLCESLDNLKRMEDAGAAAVVLPSIFEEQIRQDTHTLHHESVPGSEKGTEIPVPRAEEFQCTPDGYLDQIAQAKQAIGVPVIASLNGTVFGCWAAYARDVEQAGADALELNLYAVPTNPDVPAEEIETSYLTIVASLRAQLKIPIAVKLSPYFTNLSHFARRLEREGADGLVLFNRFYQPDIDLDTLKISPTIHLSSPGDIRLPLRWIAMLHGRIRPSLAATGGIHSGADALKMILAGADVTMLCSALMHHGIEHLRVIEREMREWMEKKEYESLHQLQGIMSQKNCSDPSAFERVHYMRALGIDRMIEP